MTNNNLEIKNGETIEILLGTSTGFLVQNLSEGDIGFKLKNSDEDVIGGILESKKTVKLAADTLFWSLNKANGMLYILRD